MVFQDAARARILVFSRDGFRLSNPLDRLHQQSDPSLSLSFGPFLSQNLSFYTFLSQYLSFDFSPFQCLWSGTFPSQNARALHDSVS